MTHNRTPDCHCCATITGRPPTEAHYEWTGPNGHPVPLCPACCAWWATHATDDPWLTPLRVVALTNKATA